MEMALSIVQGVTRGFQPKRALLGVSLLLATVGLGVSEFVYRIFGFSGFMSSMD